MQLEKTDGPTHPDETLGNDADAGKIPPPSSPPPLIVRHGRKRAVVLSHNPPDMDAGNR